MKRIGLTQRVDVVAGYHERRDCLDQSWINLLLELGYMPIPLPNIKDNNATVPYLQALSLDGVILTGGNDLSWTESPRAAIERDQFESVLIDYCTAQKIAILGVCRGMQMLNVHFGGELIKIDQHVTPSHKVTFSDGSFSDVNSYHDWGITGDKLSKKLIALGHSDDGLVEYCKHKTLPITAMMWHPERSNTDSTKGRDIIKETFL